MTILAGESFVWCLVKCKECDQVYEKRIGCVTFAAYVFEDAGWRQGLEGVWLCPECVKTSHYSYALSYEQRRLLAAKEE